MFAYAIAGGGAPKAGGSAEGMALPGESGSPNRAV